MKDFFKTYGRMVAFFAVIVVIGLVGINSQSQSTSKESIRVLEESLYRATVQCYAIESQYPPSIEYLETNYGVKIDWKKYQVFYTPIASNIMPDIAVVSLE